MVLRHALAQVRAKHTASQVRFSYSIHFIKAQLEGFRPLTLQQFSRIAFNCGL